MLSKPLFTSLVKTPTSLIRELGSPGDWVAETLFVLRPLVYGMLPDLHSIVFFTNLETSHYAQQEA